MHDLISFSVQDAHVPITAYNATPNERISNYSIRIALGSGVSPTALDLDADYALL